MLKRFSPLWRKLSTRFSNLETRYRRNFIRQSLLPLLKEHYPAAAANLLSFSDIAQELFNDVEHLARRWLESVEETLASRWAGDHRRSALAENAFLRGSAGPGFATTLVRLAGGLASSLARARLASSGHVAQTLAGD